MRATWRNIPEDGILQTHVLFFLQLRITPYLQQYLAEFLENQTHRSLDRNIDIASH
jgi:hypothetical protein